MLITVNGMLFSSKAPASSVTRSTIICSPTSSFFGVPLKYPLDDKFNHSGKLTSEKVRVSRCREFRHRLGH